VIRGVTRKPRRSAGAGLSRIAGAGSKPVPVPRARISWAKPGDAVAEVAGADRPPHPERVTIRTTTAADPTPTDGSQSAISARATRSQSSASTHNSSPRRRDLDRPRTGPRRPHSAPSLRLGPQPRRHAGSLASDASAPTAKSRSPRRQTCVGVRSPRALDRTSVVLRHQRPPRQRNWCDIGAKIPHYAVRSASMLSSTSSSSIRRPAQRIVSLRRGSQLACTGAPTSA
jgi:hypothetical protein